MMTSFECVVIDECQSRRGSGGVYNEEYRLVTGVDLNDLYEKLGEAKSNETPLEVRDRGDYYTKVTFGKIREVVVISEAEVNHETLMATSAWQEHVRQREADALRKKLALEANQAAVAAEKEVREYAEYVRLRAKFL